MSYFGCSSTWWLHSSPAPSPPPLPSVTFRAPCASTELLLLTSRTRAPGGRTASPAAAGPTPPSWTFSALPASSSKLGCSEPTMELLPKWELGKSPGIAFSEREANLHWRKVCEVRRARSDRRVPSETVYRRALSFLSSSFLLHFLPSYPTQAPTNSLKSVWSVVQNEDSIEGEQRQGCSHCSSRGWTPLNHCMSKSVQRASGRAGCLYQKQTLIITCISYLQ